MILSPMEIDYWRTRTVEEAEAEGYSHLRVTCQGCGKLTDLPWTLLLRRPGITRDTFLGNCEKCGRNDPENLQSESGCRSFAAELVYPVFF